MVMRLPTGFKKIVAKPQLKPTPKMKANLATGRFLAAKPGGKGKGQSKGGRVFVPARSMPMMLATRGKGQGKGKGLSKGKAAPAVANQSKFMEKLATIDASQKVWIGDLNLKTTWKELERHVQEVTGSKPSITEILPKGKACLAFKSDDDASTAISLLNSTELLGKDIQADVWTQREKTEKSGGAAEAGQKKRARNKKGNAALANIAPPKVTKTLFAKKALGKAAQAPGKKTKVNKLARGDPKMKEKLSKVDHELKVWVGGMKPETSHGLLRKTFAEAGHKPQLVNLSGKTNACVSFKTEEEAQAAIAEMNGTDLDGNTLEVDVWTKPGK
jgi:RNA recognition motif-containing protein